MKKTLFIIAGSVLLGLAALGLALPVLPATPFLLGASACFLKGSDRLHRAITSNRLFGPRLRAVREGKGLTRKEKWTIYLTALAFIAPIMILSPSWHLRAFLGLVLAVKAVVFLRMKTRAA